MSECELYRQDKCPVSELQAELAQHRWIPVAERLPEDGKVVFCSNGRTVTTGWWYEAWCRWCKEASYDEVWAKDSTATHWKPIILPEEKDNG